MKSSISKTAAKCALCDFSNSRELFALKDHEYPDTTDDVFYFHECLSCGLIFLNPRPSEEELSTIYPPDYYAFDQACTGSGKQGISVKSVSKHFELRRLKSLLAAYRLEPVKSVYDIGCGDGFDLDVFRQVLGSHLKTAGIDMSFPAVEKARRRGHDVQAGLFQSELEAKGPFDVVISKHVIEHVDDPLGFLMKARSIVASNGLIIIDTPNVNSPLRTIFGKHWGGWHTPRHWYLFSPETFEVLATKADLKVLGVYQLPINMYWVWGLHSFFFERNRKIADKLFDPVGTSKSGIWGIGLLSLFQFFEIILKFVTRRTSQMRIVLAPS